MDIFPIKNKIVSDGSIATAAQAKLFSPKTCLNQCRIRLGSAPHVSFETDGVAKPRRQNLCVIHPSLLSILVNAINSPQQSSFQQRFYQNKIHGMTAATLIMN